MTELEIHYHLTIGGVQVLPSPRSMTQAVVMQDILRHTTREAVEIDEIPCVCTEFQSIGVIQ